MKRYGSVIGIKLQAIEEYKRYHSNAWPEVLDMLCKCDSRTHRSFAPALGSERNG